MLQNLNVRLTVIMVACKAFEYSLFSFKALISETITVSSEGLVYIFHNCFPSHFLFLLVQTLKMA